MKTATFTFLFVSIFIKSSFQIHPRYSYVCKEDGSVEFTGFKTNSKVTIVSKPCTGNGVTTKQTRQVVIIDKDCMGKNLTADRQITVNVKDGNLNETVANPTPQSVIIGGLESHTFVLQCTHISTVNRTVLRQFHLIDTENILSKENEIGQVDMRFKAEDNIDLPDISEVYIGDEFYMFLQYKGESDYLIEPQSCTAFAGNDIFASKIDNVTLWNISGKATHQCMSDRVKSLGLLGNDGFKYFDESTVRTRINGFRFGSNQADITIFCRVLLKVPPSQDLPKDTGVCTSITATGRRKRSPHSSDSTPLAVMQTLSVKDGANPGSSFASRSVAQVITITASLFIMRMC